MTKPKADPDRVAENIQRRELVSGVEAGGRRFGLAAALIVLGVALGILLMWRMSSSLLIIFAGVLFASFLDACARALGPVIPVGRAWRLTLVILILTALIVLGAVWGVGKVPEQARLLIRVTDAQLDVLQQRLLSVGAELFGPDGGRDFSRRSPDHDMLLGHAQTAGGTASSVLANTLVIVFLGLLSHLIRNPIATASCCWSSPRRATVCVRFWMKWAVSCARGLWGNLSGSCL